MSIAISGRRIRNTVGLMLVGAVCACDIQQTSNGAPGDGGTTSGESPRVQPDAGALGASVWSNAGCSTVSLPELGSPRTFETSYNGLNGACGDATTAGDGTIALEWNPGHMTPSWQTVAPDGTPLGHLDGWNGTVLIPQASGFVLGDVGGTYIWYALFPVDANGARVGTGTPVRGYGQIAIAPGGGFVIAGSLDPGASQQVWMFNADATLRWNSPVDAFAAGVDVAGNTLVVSADGFARWVAGDGTPAGEKFRVDSGFDPRFTRFNLVPLAGGGIAVQHMAFTGGVATGYWVAVALPGESTARELPRWLLDRSNAQLFVGLGGRANIAVPRGRELATCTQAVEVLAPNGELCGTYALPLSASSCTSRDVRIGLDGTLLQRIPDDLDQLGTRSCALRYWPAVFK